MQTNIIGGFKGAPYEFGKNRENDTLFVCICTHIKVFNKDLFVPPPSLTLG